MGALLGKDLQCFLKLTEGLVPLPIPCTPIQAAHHCTIIIYCLLCTGAGYESEKPETPYFL